MVTLIICLAVAIIITLHKEWYWVDSFLDFIMYSFLGGIWGGILGFIIMFSLPDDRVQKTLTYKIESLQDNNSVNGNFFLGCGSIEGEMKYVFYYEVNGGFRMKQVSYTDALIKYSTDVKVVVHTEERTDSFINLFAVDFPKDDTYEIFVPKGTIKNNYNLNSQ